ncbi:MAG TPA: methionine synthase [Anaerolineaceae bacterium]|uniref:Cobalamin B12-binding domain protein n=1 Tax=Anaerolinea thermophila TaxID=167964 RepID=A0A101FYB5_9CHLR|nr:MAG: cobalamin B12-binding domain protein [Anaerolinea thermophila]HAF62482.1 methionine synthase [Anaerolineaceae bacterium]
MSQALISAITEMREEDARQITTQLLDGGADPLKILDSCKQAMDIIGDQFENGEAFIPELILAGEMIKSISEILKSHMTEEVVTHKLGKVVIGTVQGDIHNIAKDIVVFMLDINGFEVTDLGVDVSAEKFVEAVKETEATIVGLSGFLTTAYDPMKVTVAALKEAKADVKIMIGGGQVNERICVYTGADAYGQDAIAAVSLAKQWIGA